MKNLKEKIDALTPDERKKVEHLVTKLLNENGDQNTGSLNQTWAGALKEFREQYTAEELQEKAMDWRRE